MGTDHTISPAAIEFQRALVLFTVRQNHGHIAPAFQEFIMEPDIVSTGKLGPDTVTEMVTSAVHLVHETKEVEEETLNPTQQILTNENTPLADAAQILLDAASSDGPTVAVQNAHDSSTKSTPQTGWPCSPSRHDHFPAPRRKNDPEIE